MGKIITIATLKGGAGKTTTAVNLGASLGVLKKKVLIIDLDEKANATLSLGLNKELINYSSFDLLTTNIDINKIIYKTKEVNLDIIPSSSKLSRIYDYFENEKDNDTILDMKISTLKDDYDFIIIDTPPSTSLLTENAIFCCDSVIVPVDCELYGYDALISMINIINNYQTRKKLIYKKLTLEGVLLTRLDSRSLTSYKIVQKVNDLIKEKTFKQVISRSSHIEEAPLNGESVVSYSFNSKGSKEYLEVAKEIIENNKGRK